MRTARSTSETTNPSSTEVRSMSPTPDLGRGTDVLDWVGHEEYGTGPSVHGDDHRLDAGEAAGLTAALAEIPHPAFVIWADGCVALANGSGLASSERAPESVASHLLASLGGRDETFRVTRILSPGGSSHFLAVEQEGGIDLPARIQAASAKWGATPRQEQVLRLLALGQSNKTIAGTLGCAPSTVELHVTALLRKSGCESRCELVSTLWSGASGHRPPAHADGRHRGRVDASTGRSLGRSWSAPLQRVNALMAGSGNGP
jgi:DNA-binding CsgD family transcriptional regulator